MDTTKVQGDVQEHCLERNKKICLDNSSISILYTQIAISDFVIPAVVEQEKADANLRKNSRNVFIYWFLAYTAMKIHKKKSAVFERTVGSVA